MARAPAADEVEGLDEEFLYHLNRGAELLSSGAVEEASAALARARDLRPRDPQVLGLLGQSLYKLGRYDDAAEAYGALVVESPVEAAARVNLGLANLKAKRYDAAVRELEIALDLNPSHKKAMGYLGLARLEQGDAAGARAWFERAGSEQMVARCDELLAARASGASAPERAPELASEVTAGDLVGEDAGAWEAAAGAAISAGEAPRAGVTVPLEGPRAEAAPAEAAARGGPLAAVRLDAIEVAAPADAAFALCDGLLSVEVTPAGVLARSEGLVAAKGVVELAPELKRFRGRTTEKPFGEGHRRMLRATGEGVLLYAPGEASFLAVDLAGASAYLREEVVFAIDATLAFENGRLASRAGPDLNLVHARGEGRVIVSSRGEVRAVDVDPSAPVRVPLDVLVAWTGALTPRIGPLAGPADAAPAAGELLAVELAGEGRVLVDTGAPARNRR